MLTKIEGLPNNVVAYEAAGELDADDYDSTLDPAIDAALEANDKIRILYVLGSNFDGFTGGAMWEDTKVGVGHWTRWERIALVTDDRVYHHGVKAFSWLVPGEVRLFSLAELDAAKEWIAS